MGWASGGELMDKIIRSAKTNIKGAVARYRFYKDAIAAFSDHDCDVLSECKGQDKIFDEALKDSGYELDDE